MTATERVMTVNATENALLEERVLVLVTLPEYRTGTVSAKYDERTINIVSDITVLLAALQDDILTHDATRTGQNG